MQEQDMFIGRKPVLELLRSERTVNKIIIAKQVNQVGIKDIISIARQKGINIQEVDRRKIDALSPDENNQGVIAYVAAKDYVELDVILEKAKQKQEQPFLLILDEIEDPHNLGAIIRTAEAAGVHGIVIPKNRAVGITPTVAKVSAGAVEHMPVARVVNIVRTIEELKEEGLWIVGTSPNGKPLYGGIDLKIPIALVIGNEAKGLGRLVAQKCDFLVSLPMLGKIDSLNASVAAAIFMYEAVRQRSQG